MLFVTVAHVGASIRAHAINIERVRPYPHLKIPSVSDGTHNNFFIAFNFYKLF